MSGVWSIISPFSVFAASRLSVALARTLSARGARVLLVELSPTVPALADMLGVSDKVVYTLSDVGRVPVGDVFLSPLPDKRKKGHGAGEILLLPLFAGETLAASAYEAIRTAVAAAKADTVFLSAEIGQAALARSVSDGVLLLTGGDAFCLGTAAAHRGALAADGFILTDFVPTRDAVQSGMGLTQMADILGLPLVGILPKDTYPWLCDRAVENIARRLLGECVPLLSGIGIEGMRKKAYFRSALR